MVRPAVSRAALPLVLLVGLAACTSSPGPTTGTVVGLAPVCYGPGPNLNLRPETTIRATPENGGMPTTVRVITNNARHTYRMILLAGRYTLEVPGLDDAIKVTVRAGVTTQADLPAQACV